MSLQLLFYYIYRVSSENRPFFSTLLVYLLNGIGF
jgi:hypothetical protein